MRSILKGAAALFAVIPGISVLSSGAAAPPGYAKLFGLFIEVVGIATLLLVFVNRKNWTKSSAAASTLGLCAGVAAILLLLVYFGLFEHCVVKVEKRGTSYIPLWVSKDLDGKIKEYHDRKGLVEHFGEDGVYEMVLKEPDWELIATNTILIAVICASVAALVLCFGSLSLRLHVEKVKVG